MSERIHGSGAGERRDFRRVMNLLAVAFLSGSLLLLIGFHFLPGFPAGDKEPGWKVWKAIWNEFQNADQWVKDPPEAIATASFLTFVGLIVVSPFFVVLFQKSRLLWWIATILSGIATIGFSALVLPNVDSEALRPGLICLFASPFLNLIGLLFIRGNARTLPGDSRVGR